MQTRLSTRLKSHFLIPFLLGLFLAACSPGEKATQNLENPADVLAAMKAKYHGSWYETLTFVQTSIEYKPDGASDTTTWYEAMALPGKLRIDIGGPNTGDALIFRNDSIYVYNGGNLISSRVTYHPLLLLGFDAYFLETEDLMARLDSINFDLTVMHESTWQERPVYVIGASEGDSLASQFWIDKERLVFVRMIQKVGPTGEVLQEVQFNRYESVGDGWVAPEVLFFTNGKLSFKEIYNDVTAGVEFDARLFSPQNWASAIHWYDH